MCIECPLIRTITAKSSVDQAPKVHHRNRLTDIVTLYLPPTQYAAERGKIPFLLRIIDSKADLPPPMALEFPFP